MREMPRMNNQPPERRVPIWNHAQKRKITGNSAPLERNLQKYLKQHTDCEVLVAQDKGVPLVGDKDKAPALSPDNENYGAGSGLLPGTMQAPGLPGQPQGKMPIYHQGGSSVVPLPTERLSGITNVVTAGASRYSYQVYWADHKHKAPLINFSKIEVAKKISKNPLAHPRIPLHGLIAKATFNHRWATQFVCAASS